MGISTPFVSDIERNRSLPTYPLLKKLIAEFKVDPKWLLE
ncbi:MAG: helix-turn-helix transcriptional regulator [Candidatus Magnetobacterium sp. LHC-1]